MNKILRYITLVGIFIIPFLPLVVANSLFFPFITGKNFGFRIIIEIIFAAWLILAATDKAYWPRRSWIMYSFAAFVGIMAIADAAGVFPYKSFWSNYERMEGWITLAHLFAYFLVAATVLAKESLWDAFFQTSFGVNCTIILYSLLQISGLLTINQGGVRVDATFGNATYLAIYALFNIFIATLFFIRKPARASYFKNLYIALGFNVGFFLFILPQLKQAAIGASAGSAFLFAFIGWIVINLAMYLTVFLRQERVMYGLIILFDIVTLYNTATRGSILGLIGGAIVTGILVALFDRERPVVRKSAIGVLIAMIILVGGFLAIRKTNFVTKSPVLSRFSSISLTETTTLSRFKLWNMAFKGFEERPILGWGQENFNYVFNQYYNPELFSQEQWFDRTHDVIFDWLIAGGILGLAAYLTFFGSIIFAVWKHRGEGQFSILERSIITGMLAAYFIHNLFVFDNLTSYLVFIAIAAYVYNRTAYRPAPVSQPVVNTMVAPVTAIALIIALYALNIRPLAANRTLISALQVNAQSGDITPNVDAFKSALSYHTFGDPEAREQIFSLANQVVGAQQPITGGDALLALADEEGKKQLTITPNDARYYFFYGTFLARVNKPQDALVYLNKAHELSPNKQSILFALAGTYITVNDYESAKKWLKTAYDLEPSYETARLNYAAASIYTNDMKTADTLLSPLPLLTVASSNDVLQALYTTKHFTELITLWKARVVADPSAQNHVSLAAAYLYAGDRKDAIAELQTAIKLEPSFKTQGEDYIKQIQAGKTP